MMEVGDIRELFYRTKTTKKYWHRDKISLGLAIMRISDQQI